MAKYTQISSMRFEHFVTTYKYLNMLFHYHLQVSPLIPEFCLLHMITLLHAWHLYSPLPLLGNWFRSNGSHDKYEVKIWVVKAFCLQQSSCCWWELCWSYGRRISKCIPESIGVFFVIMFHYLHNLVSVKVLKKDFHNYKITFYPL